MNPSLGVVVLAAVEIPAAPAWLVAVALLVLICAGAGELDAGGIEVLLSVGRVVDVAFGWDVGFGVSVLSGVRVGLEVGLGVAVAWSSAKRPACADCQLNRKNARSREEANRISLLFIFFFACARGHEIFKEAELLAKTFIIHSERRIIEILTDLQFSLVDYFATDSAKSANS